MPTTNYSFAYWIEGQSNPHITGNEALDDIDAAIFAATGVALSLDGLTDVTITSPANGDVIYRTGGVFVNSPFNELVDDRVGALVVAGTDISVTYNDGAGTLTIDYTGSVGTQPFDMVIAVSDETTALTTGTSKITFRMPDAVTLTGVRASLSTAQTSGSIFTVDINEGGSTILSTKLTIDNGEKTSATAAAAAVISDTSLADDAEMTIDIDQVGDGSAKGLKVTLIGSRT